MYMNKGRLVDMFFDNGFWPKWWKIDVISPSSKIFHEIKKPFLGRISKMYFGSPTTMWETSCRYNLDFMLITYYVNRST